MSEEPPPAAKKSPEYAVGSVNMFPSEGEGLCDPAFGRRVCLCFEDRFVGNMVVLVRDRRGRPLVVVGPYWTMLVFVTIPLVVVGPSLIAALWCERLVVEIQITYSLLVGLAAASVAATAFRNPGILERHDTAPDETWTWNDQAQTFKPPSARYCPWCNCVVVGFDHTCPWMGTAIGKNNLYSFRCFVFVVQILAYYTAAVFLLGSFGVAQRK